MKATGKRGWCSPANGRLAVVDHHLRRHRRSTTSNKAVFDTDPKALETLDWLFDHIKDETITYGGSLPKGQGVDALFYASSWPPSSSAAGSCRT